MRAIPAVVQHLLRSRADRCPPEIQRGSGRAMWGMVYADDACIVSRPPQGLAKMIEVVVEVCRAFALTVSAKKTETVCMPPLRTPRTMVQVEAAGQIYKQVPSFTYLGSAVTEVSDMSVEIAKRNRAYWMRIAVPTGALRPTGRRALPQDPNG